MMEQKLRQTLSAVTMPEDMRSRLAMNVAAKTRRRSFRLRPAVVAAVLALCITIPLGVAAFGSEGYFQDVKNFFGAITGTEYENATQEISVTAEAEGNALLLHVQLLAPEKAPYPYIEQLSISSYEFLDHTGKVLSQGKLTEGLPMKDGQVTFRLSLPDGAASAKITEFTAHAKAEQPLPIYGEWVCPVF